MKTRCGWRRGPRFSDFSQEPHYGDAWLAVIIPAALLLGLMGSPADGYLAQALHSIGASAPQEREVLSVRRSRSLSEACLRSCYRFRTERVLADIVGRVGMAGVGERLRAEASIVCPRDSYECSTVVLLSLHVVHPLERVNVDQSGVPDRVVTLGHVTARPRAAPQRPGRADPGDRRARE